MHFPCETNQQFPMTCCWVMIMLTETRLLPGHPYKPLTDALCLPGYKCIHVHVPRNTGYGGLLVVKRETKEESLLIIPQSPISLIVAYRPFCSKSKLPLSQFFDDCQSSLLETSASLLFIGRFQHPVSTGGALTSSNASFYELNITQVTFLLFLDHYAVIIWRP